MRKSTTEEFQELQEKLDEFKRTFLSMLEEDWEKFENAATGWVRREAGEGEENSPNIKGLLSSRNEEKEK